MHRAALAVRAAGLPPEQLGHYCARTYAARQCLTVIAISGDDVVVRADHRHYTGGDCLLPDVEVTDPADFAERVSFRALLLEATLDEHRTEQLASQLGRRSTQIVARLGVGAVVTRFALFLGCWF